ncbi:hypothetical protein OQA88_13475 [Cercophora sp. LCS_1]
MDSTPKPTKARSAMAIIANLVTSSDWKACIIKTLVLDNVIMPFMLPQIFNTRFDVVCYFLLLTPEVMNHAPFEFTAGYIDRFYMTKAHQRSRAGLFLCVCTLVLRRLLPLVWLLPRHCIGFLWTHMGTIMTWFFGFSALWWPAPVKWKQNARYYLWEYPILWPVWVEDTIMFAAMRASSWAMTHSAAAIRRLILVLYPLPTEPFSYAADAPRLSDASGQIRLLKLHRKLPFFPLSGELEAHWLKDMPLYHAVSYVWAHGPQDSRPIIVNGKVMRITGNLREILTRCTSFISPHYIWVDAICIDQGTDEAHLEEKAKQIRLMGDIYQGAIHVAVCLGEGPSFLAFLLFRELKTLKKTLGALSDAMLTMHVSGYLPRQRTDLLLRARIKALVDLLQHPWFHRVWVVQEVVMARHVTFHYGDETMPMTTFYEMVEFFTNNVIVYVMLLYLGSDGSFQGPYKTATMSSRFLSLPTVGQYRVSKLRSEPRSISDILRDFGAREATQPIDKVFALIGISKEKAQLDSLVDYKRKPADILLDLAHFMLDTGRPELDLAGIGYGGWDTEVPSWVVDWTSLRDQSLEEAVWRTMVGDKTLKVRPAPPSAVDLLKFSLDFARASMTETHSRVKSGAGYVDSMFGSVGSSFMAPHNVEKYGEMMKLASDGGPYFLFDSNRGSDPMMFCTTEKGYVGMVPPLSQPGDCIFLIFGSGVPYTLRAESCGKGNQRYQLVGESYVHGIMDGEALNSPEEEREITLY